MFSLSISLIGIIAAVKQLIEQTGQLIGIFIILSFISVYLILIVRNPMRRRESSIFPTDVRYKVIVPATINQQKRIAEACVYFGDAAIDPIDGQNSIQSDPYSTVALSDYNGREIGFGDYYCFDIDDAKKYIAGKISNTDLFADYYLAHPAARNCNAIYISTIFRYDHISDRSLYGVKETAMLVWSLIKLIETIQNEPEEGWFVFTSGGSREGDRLINHFDLVDKGARDNSGNIIYERENVTRAELEIARKKFDYLGNQVQFDVVGIQQLS